MSVISGFYPFKTWLCPKTVNHSLLNSFPHPGHLEGKIWSGTDLALGHRDLPFTPQLESEAQPLWLELHDLVITADARLDNRDELVDKLSLQRPGSAQKDLSDGVLILKSFLKWGEQCPKHLLGDFVFAIWNNRTKELFAARDHFGIRPFYYHCSIHFFSFCNELKGLVNLPHVKTILNDYAVADFLTGNYEDCENTIHPNIKRLPPAHSLWLKDTTVRVKRYWRLEKQEPLILAKDSDYADALREQIYQATACRLRTSFPVGVMLSGGLDSSALTSITNQISHQKNVAFSTYSYVLPTDHDGDQTDEKKFIEILLQNTGSGHHYVTAPKQNGSVYSDEYFDILGEPLRDPFYFIQKSIYEKAEQNNVRVLLTGIGGDMTASFSGRNCLASLALQLQLRKVYDLLHLRRSISEEEIPMLIRRQIIAKLLPKSLHLVYRSLFRKSIPHPIMQYAVNSSLAKRVHLQHRLKRLKHIEAKQNALNHQRQIQYSVTSGHLSAFMEHRHTTAASFGISVNHPYFDMRVVKFCMSLPHEQFIKDGWYRSVFRRAITDIVPKEITHRFDKQPFVPDYDQRIIRNEAVIRNILYNNNMLVSKYLNRDIIIDHLNLLCSTSNNLDWHPSTISLLGHGVSLAAFLHWFNIEKCDQT